MGHSHHRRHHHGRLAAIQTQGLVEEASTPLQPDSPPTYAHIDKAIGPDDRQASMQEIKSNGPISTRSIPSPSFIPYGDPPLPAKDGVQRTRQLTPEEITCLEHGHAVCISSSLSDTV